MPACAAHLAADATPSSLASLTSWACCSTCFLNSSPCSLPPSAHALRPSLLMQHALWAQSLRLPQAHL